MYMLSPSMFTATGRWKRHSGSMLALRRALWLRQDFPVCHPCGRRSQERPDHPAGVQGRNQETRRTYLGRPFDHPEYTTSSSLPTKSPPTLSGGRDGANRPTGRPAGAEPVSCETKHRPVVAVSATEFLYQQRETPPYSQVRRCKGRPAPTDTERHPEPTSG